MSRKKTLLSKENVDDIVKGCSSAAYLTWHPDLQYRYPNWLTILPMSILHYTLCLTKGLLDIQLCSNFEVRNLWVIKINWSVRVTEENEVGNSSYRQTLTATIWVVEYPWPSGDWKHYCGWAAIVYLSQLTAHSPQLTASSQRSYGSITETAGSSSSRQRLSNQIIRETDGLWTTVYNEEHTEPTVYEPTELPYKILAVFTGVHLLFWVSLFRSEINSWKKWTVIKYKIFYCSAWLRLPDSCVANSEAFLVLQLLWTFQDFSKVSNSSACISFNSFRMSTFKWWVTDHGNENL